ncbi:hypothetical protein LguiA_014000 [Lonicera macranthoides]
MNSQHLLKTVLFAPFTDIAFDQISARRENISSGASSFWFMKKTSSLISLGYQETSPDEPTQLAHLSRSLWESGGFIHFCDPVDEGLLFMLIY